jgi:hypothetical protein
LHRALTNSPAEVKKIESAVQEVPNEVKEAMELCSEDVQPWHTYWYHRPTKNFPPPSIQKPEEYDGSDRLALACTQTGLPAAQQRKLMEKWCSLLPQLENVRILWLKSRVPQELFNAACKMKQLRGLYIKWGPITDLTPLSNLKTLTHLHLGGAVSAKPLTALSSLDQLIDLEIENVNAASDLSFLQGLPQLKAFTLAGLFSGPKSLAVKKLTPISDLKNLERLSLSVLTIDDESLAPIADLPKLKHLRLSNQFLMEEVAGLAGRMPAVQSRSFEPLDPQPWFACKKCKKYTLVQLTGKGKPRLCSVCDAKKIAAFMEAFNRIVEISRKSAFRKR